MLGNPVSRTPQNDALELQIVDAPKRIDIDLEPRIRGLADWPRVIRLISEIRFDWRGAL